jgi:hypothetical protein
MSCRSTVRTARTPLWIAVAFAIVVGAAVSVTTAADASAQARAAQGSGQSLRDRVFSRNLPPRGRFVSETGQAFVFDRSGPRPLLRFERSTEIWVLRATPAPRGDIIYRNDNGDQVLRVTPDGGMTLYTTTSPRGAPAALSGEGDSLAPPTLSPVQLWNFIVRQSDRASRTLGRLVVVDVDIRPGSEAVAADALSTATDAIARLVRTPEHQRQVAEVRRILVTDEGRAGVTFERGLLRIVIDPAAGPAGRPSSARLIRLISETR